jgi:hypothetical protein
MAIAFIINFAIFLAVALISIVNYFRHNNDERLKKAFNYMALIGLAYLLLAVVSFLWIFNIIEYSTSDFEYFYFITLLFEGLVFFRMLYIFSRNKRMIYFLIFYLISISLSFLLPFWKISLANAFSFLFMIVVFMYFSFLFCNYRRTCYFGVFYSLIGVITQILSFFGVGEEYSWNMLLSILFFILCYLFFESFKKSPLEHMEKARKEERQSIIFLKYFVFITVISNFIFLGTVGIHELGHLAVSKFYDCDYRQVIYSQGATYTEALCSNINGSANSLILVGGFLLAYVIGISLFLIGGKFMKEVALLIIGFNTIISYKDFASLGLSTNISIAIVILGIFFAVIGILMLAKSRTEE